MDMLFLALVMFVSTPADLLKNTEVKEEFCAWHWEAINNTPEQVRNIDYEFVLQAGCGTSQTYDQLITSKGDGLEAKDFAQVIFIVCLQGDATACDETHLVTWAKRTGWTRKQILDRFEKALD